MSDLHGSTIGIDVPDGDLLIIAGDVCSYGKVRELEIFDEFLSSLPHPLKLFVAGNHDWPFVAHTPAEIKQLVRNAIYLQDSGFEYYGLRFWGSPWQPWFMNWAFNLPRGPKLAQVWSKIPDDTDILITHSPPYGILDLVEGNNVGCEELASALKRVRPKVHVFGHIHEGYGLEERDGTIYVNASLNNSYYQLVNEPIIINI
jgi:Icc-related predicted phosphoesterase